MAALVGVLVSTVTLLAPAAPASAATLQDFVITSSPTGPRVTAKGVFANGTGSVLPTSDTSEILLLPQAPFFLDRTVGSHSERLDPRTCEVVVLETGTFSFTAAIPPNGLVGGDGNYTLSEVKGRFRPPGGGCGTTVVVIRSSVLVARATSVFVVPPPPPPPPPPGS